MVGSSWSEILDLRLAPCPYKVFGVVLLGLILAGLGCTLVEFLLSFEEIDFVEKGRHLLVGTNWSSKFHVLDNCLNSRLSVIDILFFCLCATLGPFGWLNRHLLELNEFAVVLLGLRRH